MSGIPYWLRFLALAGLLALGPVAVAQETRSSPPEQPVDSFVERIEVTAVELMIDVRDRSGLRVFGLGAKDFEVLEDGKPMQVLGVDYLDRPGSGALTLAPSSSAPESVTADPRQDSWRFLIYFDLSLTGQRSVRRAVETLLRQVDELVALGPVEVVVADPSPSVVLHFSRDAARLRRVLESLKDAPAGHRLARIRRDFLHMLDRRIHLRTPGPAERQAVYNQIRTAVDKEYRLLDQRLTALGRWIGAYGNVPGSAAILVSDGFDLDPEQFYLTASAVPDVEAELSLELSRFKVGPMVEAVASEISAGGWVSIIMAFGGGSEIAAGDASTSSYDRFRSIAEPSGLGAGPGTGSPSALLERRVEPLMMVSERTGGEVLTARKTAAGALERIGERVRLTYLAARPKDGKTHQVEVRAKSEGLVVRAPQVVRSPTREQISASRVKRLLIEEQAVGELPTRLRFTEPADGGGTVGEDGSVRRAGLEIVFDLDLLRSVLPDKSVVITFTVGIELTGAAPFVYQLAHQVVLPPRQSEEPWPSFLFPIVLEVPRNAGRVAVVVEEPASGIWGGAVDDPGL